MKFPVAAEDNVQRIMPRNEAQLLQLPQLPQLDS